VKNNLIIFFIFIATYLPAPLAFTANQIFHYQPEVTTLTGVIKIEKFFAPPKNENIGDKEETYRYLVLDSPIDIVPRKNDTERNNELQRNVETIQVVRIEDSNIYETHEHSNWSDKLINKHVHVTVRLYSRVVRAVILATHFEIIK